MSASAPPVNHRHPDKPDELYIDEVGTAATHLRRGIATRMVEAMFTWGHDSGLPRGLGWVPNSITSRPTAFTKKVGGTPGAVYYYEFEL